MVYCGFCGLYNVFLHNYTEFVETVNSMADVLLMDETVDPAYNQLGLNTSGIL